MQYNSTSLDPILFKRDEMKREGRGRERGGCSLKLIFVLGLIGVLGDRTGAGASLRLHRLWRWICEKRVN